jgi:hypothetical protein
MARQQSFDTAAEAAHGAGGISIPDILIADLLHHRGSLSSLPDPFADQMRRLLAHP